MNEINYKKILGVYEKVLNERINHHTILSKHWKKVLLDSENNLDDEIVMRIYTEHEGKRFELNLINEMIKEETKKLTVVKND